MNISSRPTYIRRQRNSFASGAYAVKLPAEAVTPKAAPVFESIASTVPIVDSISKPCMLSTIDENRNIARYVSMKPLIPDIT